MPKRLIARLGRSPRRLVVAFVGGVMMIAAAVTLVVATGHIPSADGTIYGCYVSQSAVHGSTGMLRVVGDVSECRASETPIFWNQTGPQGPPGNLVLAGQSCPPGQAVTGFDADGNLICDAFMPFSTPTPTPVPPTPTPTPVPSTPIPSTPTP